MPLVVAPVLNGPLQTPHSWREMSESCVRRAAREPAVELGDGVDIVEERMVVYVLAIRNHNEEPKLVVTRTSSKPRCHLRINVQLMDI